MIKFNVCPPGGDEWTEVLVAGEDEEAVAGVLHSRLDAMEWEVELEDNDEQTA